MIIKFPKDNRYITQDLAFISQAVNGSELSSQEYVKLRYLFLDWIYAVHVGFQTELGQAICQINNIKSENFLQSILMKPVAESAWLLGTLAHASEIDDSEFIGETHPSAVIFSTLINGSSLKAPLKKTLSSAYVGYASLIYLGRIMNPNHYNSGWHGTGTIGTLGASSALCSQFQLNFNQIENGLAIAAMQISGIQGSFGTQVKPLNAGAAARNGSIGALLAKNNIHGKSDIFECHHGILDQFNSAAGTRLESFNFSLDYIRIKKFPSCHSTHAFIEAALKLKDSINSEKIDSIEIVGSSYAIEMTSIKKPGSRAEAFFSTPFCVALALLFGNPQLEHFESNFITNPLIIDLLEKIQLKIDKTFSEFQVDIILTTNTGTLSQTADVNRSLETLDGHFVKDRFDKLFKNDKISSEILSANGPLILEDVLNLF